MQVKVVPAKDGFPVLGTKYTVVDGIQAEFNNRLAAGWAKFHVILLLYAIKQHLAKSGCGCSMRLWGDRSSGVRKV